jgi:thiamine biosynthesis lipoprotein
MKETRILMGMPVAIEVVDKQVTEADIDRVYHYFRYVDETFSTYKSTSEIMRINRGELIISLASPDMQEVFALSEKTKRDTDGFFDIQKPDGSFDPSGLVKGWAIWNAAKMLDMAGFKNFFVEAGGDIEVRGKNEDGKLWSVGIRNPFNAAEIVKVLRLSDCGVATSGSYIRGDHIYNPKNSGDNLSELSSITVIGPNIYEADRFATAAFAMGTRGIYFIESLPGFEGYAIDARGIATETTRFSNFVQK